MLLAWPAYADVYVTGMENEPKVQLSGTAGMSLEITLLFILLECPCSI